MLERDGALAAFAFGLALDGEDDGALADAALVVPARGADVLDAVDDLGDFRHATQDRRNPRCGERINLQPWKAVMQAHEQRLRHDRIADLGGFGRVLPVSEDVMFKWRLLVETGRKAGRTFPQPDLIIAATALHHGLTVVTRNTADFAALGIDALNPFEWRRDARS